MWAGQEKGNEGGYRGLKESGKVVDSAQGGVGGKGHLVIDEGVGTHLTLAEEGAPRGSDLKSRHLCGRSNRPALRFEPVATTPRAMWPCSTQPVTRQMALANSSQWNSPRRRPPGLTPGVTAK